MPISKRFYIPSYVLNTIRLRVKTKASIIAYGSYPYPYFKEKVKLQPQNPSTKNINTYTALSYFDYQKAANYHSEPRSFTQDLILGLTYYNDLLTGKETDRTSLLSLTSILISELQEKEGTLVYYFPEPYALFDLKGGYYSGIVQGKMASLLVRCYQLTADRQYLETAKKVLKACLIPTKRGGVYRSLDEAGIWIEEYPSPSPSMVLNGFGFSIIGIADYLSIAQDDELYTLYTESITSFTSWLPFYMHKGEMLYSMKYWQPCNVHYTAISKYLFAHLQEITGLDVFQPYIDFCKERTDWKVFEKLLSK